MEISDKAENVDIKYCAEILASFKHTQLLSCFNKDLLTSKNMNLPELNPMYHLVIARNLK